MAVGGGEGVSALPIPDPFCCKCGASARLRERRPGLWEVACDGLGCGHGVTGDHTTADGALTEWKAINGGNQPTQQTLFT
jgi:hypothetical protein